MLVGSVVRGQMGMAMYYLINTFGQCLNGLLAHDFHDHALVPLAVEFSVENSLPRTEVKPPSGNRNNHFMVNQE